MSVNKHLEHDIFVSYGQVDDQPTSGMEQGWVTTLVADLRVLLDQRLGRIGSSRIWWDRSSLERHGTITPAIEQALDRTAVLLIICSEGYLSSPWCDAEREHFLSVTGASDPERKRVFLVEKNAIELGRRPDGLGDSRCAE